MATTYEPIATTTLGSNASSITFGSIPSTYTDLRLVCTYLGTSIATGTYLLINSDTSSSYSQTYLQGSGTTATSSRASSTVEIDLNGGNASTTIPMMVSFDFFSYAGSTNKTFLIRLNGDKNGSGYITYTVGLWRSTSAINTLQLVNLTGAYAAGTTATLYGIKSA